MYIPKLFEINDEQMIEALIETYSFATVFTQHNGQPSATHIPLLLNKEERTLYGHVARQNDQWQHIAGEQVLAVFHGPHSYISPSWYETAKAVPTWNYVAVHVCGTVEIIEQTHTIRHSLHDLVEKYEHRQSTYSLSNVDEDFIASMSKGIVAFKIHITSIEAKAKLSQNHSVARQMRIIEALEKTSNEHGAELATFMRKNV